MKKLNTLLIAGALLGTAAFGGAIGLSYQQPTNIVYAETSETSTSEETTVSPEEQALIDKINELEKTIKEQSEQIWNKDLVSGLTIGGAILFGMEALLVLFRVGFNKKKDGMFNDKFMKLEQKCEDLYSKYTKAKEDNEQFLTKACSEMNAIKNDCLSLVKEIQGVIPQLKQYEQFNQKVVTIINILETISFTPENVKNGVSEKVKQLVLEVR